MSFENQLLKWYLNNKRDLPWRKNKDPYRVWISEIILQQTRVVQGRKYYKNFITKFPTINSLASSNESDVLNVWKGLGYYSRAINLHKSSKEIINNFDGTFPSKYSDIIKLKGVGDYTASAISSICFNEFNAVVDGNVLRFISRYNGLKSPVDKLKSKKTIKEIGNKLIRKTSSPGDFNQAIMEFGALICKPYPDCDICIFKHNCLAFQKKEVDIIPVKSKKKKLKERFLNFLVFIDRDNKTMVEKRIHKDIWYKLIQFPLIESKKEIIDITLNSEFQKFLNFNNITLNKEKQNVNKAKHKLSHQQLNITFHQFGIIEVAGSGVDVPNLNNYNFPVPITNFINKILI